MPAIALSQRHAAVADELHKKGVSPAQADARLPGEVHGDPVAGPHIRPVMQPVAQDPHLVRARAQVGICADQPIGRLVGRIGPDKKGLTVWLETDWQVAIGGIIVGHDQRAV